MLQQRGVSASLTASGRRLVLGVSAAGEDRADDLDARAHVRVDLNNLDQLLTTANDDGDDPAALETALALWCGEPLEGTDFLWAEGERRNLHATLVDLLERVGRTRLAHGDARAVLQLAEQAISLEELHEPSWRLALRAEHSLGLR
jgi:two-component SAPR family response regulator